MTVSNTDSSITYTGNGATTVFPYAFLIPTSGDAQVVVYDSVTMTEVTLTVGVDCTITGIGDPAGGNVTYNPSGVPIPATKTITIRRELALTQTLDLTRQSNYDPTSLEAALDRAIMIIQQLNTRIKEDALLIPVGSSLSITDLLAATTAATASADAAALSETAAALSETNAAASAAAAAASAATITPVAAQINAASDGAPTDDDFFTFLDTTTGNLFKRSWSNLKTLLASTFQPLKTILTSLGNLANASGVLTNDGAGNLSWGQAGGLVLLTSGTVSAAAALDLVLTGYTAYRGIVVELYDFIPATDNVSLLMRVSTNGGSSYDAGAANYKWCFYWPYSSATGVNLSVSNGDTSITVTSQVGNGAAEGANATIKLMGQTNTATKPQILTDGTSYIFDDHPSRFVGFGERDAAQDTDAVRFLFSSGNIASGKYAVYGYA